MDPTIAAIAALLRTANPVDIDLREMECLTHVVYREARSEPLAAQVAVASAVINRGPPCVVVSQPRQFATHTPKQRDPKAWVQAAEVAVLVGTGVVHRYGATHFHDTSVKPYWTRNMTFVGRSGRLLFWKGY
jgi:spore germination cell wall hydrolase CwlJ-like protein